MSIHADKIDELYSSGGDSVQSIEMRVSLAGKQRRLRSSVWLSLLLLLLSLNAPVIAEAATVWSGPKVSFTKADGADPKQTANQDRLTPNVWLTRGLSQGLYNIAREGSFSHSFSPADTEWATGTTANYASLKYADWDTWAGKLGKPPATVGVNAVLHLKTDDIYLDIKFLSWSERSSGGGGFSYERSTGITSAPSSFLLSVNMVGSGTVTSNPTGINCGSTCSASFNSGSSITLTATPTSGSNFSGWSGGCAGTGLCSISLTAAQNVTANFATATVAVTYPPGWNLVGNSVQAPITVATTFNDSARVVSVWKWMATGTTSGVSYPNWAYYSPTQSDGGQSYARSKGFDFLTTINAGDGFWVNTNSTLVVQLPTGIPVTSSSFQNLSSGWHLVSTGSTESPSSFNTDLSTSPPSAGVVPLNILTLWVWDTAQSNWYFYSPSLEAKGGTTLADYITGKRYLDFTTANKTLGPGVGFWVNKP